MRFDSTSLRGAALALVLSHTARAQGATLTPAERALRDAVRADTADQVALLKRAVDMQSATMNFEGVRRVGAIFRAALDSLGFSTRWSDMSAVKRAGHLVAEHKGK